MADFISSTVDMASRPAAEIIGTLMNTLFFYLGRREVLLTGFRAKELLHKIPVRIKNTGFLQQAQPILRSTGLFRLINSFYQFFY